MVERRIKKSRNESDTCRDCWTKRFRNELYGDFLSNQGNRKHPLLLENFLEQELKVREELVTNLRTEATDVYDEMNEIKIFAGDLYMGRDKHQEKDQSSS